MEMNIEGIIGRSKKKYFDRVDNDMKIAGVNLL